MKLKCDLHIHSCLSPCGSLEMSPSLIAQIAYERNLDVIALTDHNSALNSKAFETVCKSREIVAIPGMEVTTNEEFHSLCLFSNLDDALSLSEHLYDHLISSKNIPDKFGDQVYVDAENNILGEVEKYLTGGALDYSSDQLLKIVHTMGGLFIPAHIDRAAFSISSQLGFLPPDPYDALEITTYPNKIEKGTLPLITNSDAHYPEDIGKRYFYIESKSRSPKDIFEAIKQGKISSPLIK